MTKAEKYWRIAKDLHLQFPRIIGALRDMIFQNKLSPELMIDYLASWSDALERQLSNLEFADHLNANETVVYVSTLAAMLVREEAFTADDWRECLSAMIQSYARLAADDSTGEGQALTLIRLLPVFNRKEQSDGRRLSPQETAFQEWVSEHFDEAGWLRKLKLRWQIRGWTKRFDKTNRL